MEFGRWRSAQATAVATTEGWAKAGEAGSALPQSDLGTSAAQGHQAFQTVA